MQTVLRAMEAPTAAAIPALIPVVEFGLNSATKKDRIRVRDTHTHSSREATQRKRERERTRARHAVLVVAYNATLFIMFMIYIRYMRCGLKYIQVHRGLYPNTCCHSSTPVLCLYARQGKGCFLLLQLTTALPKEKTKPLVDLLSEMLPAQSALVYPITCISLPAS